MIRWTKGAYDAAILAVLDDRLDRARTRAERHNLQLAHRALAEERRRFLLRRRNKRRRARVVGA